MISNQVNIVPKQEKLKDFRSNRLFILIHHADKICFGIIIFSEIP